MHYQSSWENTILTQESEFFLVYKTEITLLRLEQFEELRHNRKNRVVGNLPKCCQNLENITLKN